MPIYYFVPENDRPSWGAGMLYYHVFLLNKFNIPAVVLHERFPYRLKWLEVNVPFKYLNRTLDIEKNDILVIPEYYADLFSLRKIQCKKIVFVQNAFYIFDGLKNGLRYEDLGIRCVLYYMPHLKKALKMITSLPLFEVPPFIAPYYFSQNELNRKLRILIYPKFENRDWEILNRLLKEHLLVRQQSKFLRLLKPGKIWEIVELKNRKHFEVANEMQNATFFISLNTNEAFNSSVPEAMAAGCINICYEGVGPGDFLRNNVNAFVFPNNHIFPLIEKVLELVSNFENFQDELSQIRANAYLTAESYRVEQLELSLKGLFGNDGQLSFI